jgi:polar amino acid transport system ATP-binding protein
MPLVRIRGLRKSFGLHRVLDGIDLDVHEGEVTVLLGPSGSGKSTLLRCVNHLEKPDAGFVEVAGELVGYRHEAGKLRELRHREVTRQRGRIGMVFQQFNLFGHMTVLENIIEGPLAAGTARKEAAARAGELLARVGLAGREGSYPRQMSGGQQQRVACARAMITRPELIFADEPTGNLDSNASAELLSFLKNSTVQTGQSIVMVTHDPRSAAYADKVVFLADGAVVGELEKPTADSVLERMRNLGA